MIFCNPQCDSDHYTAGVGGGTFNTSELILVADILEDDDFHFLLRSELPDGVPTDPTIKYNYYRSSISATEKTKKHR